MNGILKKTLPIFAVVILILVIVLTASAVKKNNAKSPNVESKDEIYLEVKEELGGRNFTYSVTKGKIYEDLKGQIGLSSLVTMINKEVLKKEQNADGKSYWDLAREATDDEDKLEIENRMDKDIYGDKDVDALSDEEKQELIHDFVLTMYSGYGYTIDEANVKASEDLKDHYTLVLAKELYAKDALRKAISEKEDYFSSEDIEKYYNDHYNKSYYAIIIPFESSTQADVALQQLGLTTSSCWSKVEVKETTEGSDIYTKDTKGAASVKEVVDAFIKLYNTVYAYTGKEITADLYSVIDLDAEIVSDAIFAVEELKEHGVGGFTTSEEFKNYSDAALQKLEALQGELTAKNVTEEGVSKAITNITEATTLVVTDGALPAENAEIGKKVEAAYNAIKGYSASSIQFNLTDTESVLYWDYDVLAEYDSTLPSKLNNSLSVYAPFTTADDNASSNSSDATWYTKSVITNNGVSYLILKLGAVPTAELNDALKATIKDELTKEKVDEISTEDLETKVCELREKYNVVIYDKALQKEYIANCDKYSVEHKANKKNSDTLVAKIDGKEFTTDELFNFLDKTLGLASAISEITQQRMIANTYFDKYYDAATGKWTDEGKELKENLRENIEAQRLNFLSGAYAYYGYTPSSDYTWEDFMFDINGVRTEKELAMLSLYGTVSNDYIKKTIEFVSVNEETEFDKVAFLMSEEDALASAAWTVLQTRMNDLVTDKFTVNGEHLLVSKYADPADPYKSGTPVSPMNAEDENKWTDEEKALAKELIEKIYEYLLTVEGTYTTKLGNIVTAFKNAPYNVAGTPVVVNSSNEKLDYVLEYPGGSINVSQYKSAGLCVKFESLGTFSEGKMVKEFENAVKTVWAKDKEDNDSNRITIYADELGKHAIETEFGYHLYINLSSTFVNEYVSAGETVATAIPSLQEIRANNMITALNALLSDDLADSEKEKINNKVKELEEIVTSEVKTAINLYYSSVIAEFTGSYFSALLQQHDIAKMAAGTWTNGAVTVTVNSDIYTNADIIKMTDVNNESTTKSNIKYLKAEDLDSFDLTKEWLNANK